MLTKELDKMQTAPEQVFCLWLMLRVLNWKERGRIHQDLSNPLADSAFCHSYGLDV